MPTEGHLTRRERRAIIVTAIVAAVVIVAAVLMATTGAARWILGAWFPGTGALPEPTPVNAELYIDPDMQVLAAAAEDPRLDPIAETAQGKWFTDWSTAETAEADVNAYVQGASAAGQVPVLVLYRIPQRDCGAWASGGADDEQEYRDWIDGIARGLTGETDAIVIVEPDALPQLDRCEQGDRAGSLAYAVEALSVTGADVYIDAGHENWISAAEMAQRLVDVGIESVTGFSLNVAAHYYTDGEIEYAEQLRAELMSLGVEDAHYVIDTGRNGAGPQGDDNCNPPGARLGEQPQLFTGTALDGFLWIKNPGETDGQCRGGPPAGFWAPAALSLLGLGGLE
ncbi:glycoside hydrolase family 6 protein [Microbacterium sediminicola]|uniref:Glucanase n=1 Tax=Microbacterium sediminicola TaxID=415210 RepID=A0ABP4TFB2_9MICO